MSGEQAESDERLQYWYGLWRREVPHMLNPLKRGIHWHAFITDVGFDVVRWRGRQVVTSMLQRSGRQIARQIDLDVEVSS